jgi:hypothetical protein
LAFADIIFSSIVFAEDASGPAIANVQQWGEKWMVRCFEQNRYNACYPLETINFHKTAPLPDISEM